jgi:hypothetical protein
LGKDIACMHSKKRKKKEDKGNIQNKEGKTEV